MPDRLCCPPSPDPVGAADIGLRPAAGLCAILVVLVCSTFAFPTHCSARLAVFIDGRVLKVEDAYLLEDRIVLELPGGGQLTVEALNIDRVIADEVVETDGEPISALTPCSSDWVDESLPPSTPFASAIERAARKAGVHPWLLAALVQEESAFDPTAVSRAGACGLTQLMPAAALDRGVEDPFDPDQNLLGGARHLRAFLDRFHSLSLALAAYNAGPTTVERSDGVPPYRETRTFIRRVIATFCPSAAGQATGATLPDEGGSPP